jgi:GDP-L-fucose synthase
MDITSKIYVTGHTGMLGSAMIDRLQSDGYTNIITCTHKDLDLTRQSDVEVFFEAERPEYVFHIAAKTGGVMLNKQYPVEYLAEGSLIALNVLNAANTYGAKGVVYVASANVYPEDAPQPMSEELFMTGRQPFFWGGYALAKTLGIKFCECAHRQHGKQFVSAILPAVYGLNDYGTTVMPMLLDKFADAVITGKPDVTIWGTGNVYREFINSKDVVDALLFLMEYGEGGQHYNVGSGEEHTIKELAEILKKVSGFNGNLIFDTSKPDSAGRQFLNSEKLYQLGWKPRMRFADGVKEVYEEHLKRLGEETQ